MFRNFAQCISGILKRSTEIAHSPIPKWFTRKKERKKKERKKERKKGKKERKKERALLTVIAFAEGGVKKRFSENWKSKKKSFPKITLNFGKIVFLFFPFFTWPSLDAVHYGLWLWWPKSILEFGWHNWVQPLGLVSRGKKEGSRALSVQKCPYKIHTFGLCSHPYTTQYDNLSWFSHISQYNRLTTECRVNLFHAAYVRV